MEVTPKSMENGSLTAEVGPIAGGCIYAESKYSTRRMLSHPTGPGASITALVRRHEPRLTGVGRNRTYLRGQ